MKIPSFDRHSSCHAVWQSATSSRYCATARIQFAQQTMQLGELPMVCQYHRRTRDTQLRCLAYNVHATSQHTELQVQ